MKGISAVTAEGNSVQQGTNGDNGQSTIIEEPNVVVGEPEENEPAEEKPSGEDSTVDAEPEKDASYWESQYKKLQTDYGKRNESEKQWKEKFSNFGGIDKAHEYLNFLTNDPLFHEYLQNRTAKEYVGGKDISQMDDEQKEAITLVQKIAKDVIANELNKFKTENFDPIANSYRKDTINSVLGKLEGKYGDIYRENKESMADVVGQLPDHIKNNPTVDDLDDLMWSVIRRNGKFEQYAARYHEQRVKNKKQNSTEAPPSTKASENLAPPKSIQEAFDRAKKKLGIAGEFRM